MSRRVVLFLSDAEAVVVVAAFHTSRAQSVGRSEFDSSTAPHGELSGIMRRPFEEFPMRLVFSAFVLALCVFPGCSDSEAGQGVATGESIEDAKGGVDVGADVKDTSLPDLPGAGLETSGLEVSPDASEGFGETCASHDDCPSGWCLDGQCTINCISECPSGWTCQKVTSRDGPDLAFLCVQDTPLHCHECTTDAECDAPGARCVSIAAEGTFCMLACGGSAQDICPEGSVCTPHEGGAPQCLPATNTCLCNAESAGTVEVCSGGGTIACQGTRTCQGDNGWTGCNAVEPADETCNGEDDDCDGVTDETDSLTCTTFFPDNDNDGAGGGSASACLCMASAEFPSATSGDCDDTDPKVKPGASEVCNTLDDDCDGATDPASSTGCTTYFEDGDADGYGVAGSTQCVCVPSQPWTALIPGDCDDTVQNTHPSAPESCNNVDDDCDSLADEGLAGAPCLVENVHGACPGVATCVDGAGVCKGKEPAPEICNGSDDDCDGLNDEGTSGALCLHETDAGSCVGKELCLGAAGLICDAKDPVPEACNGDDDDCDGQVDETGSTGCVQYHADLDKDGFGADDVADCLCKPGAPFTALTAGDCDDTQKASYPGAAENCDGKDNDCDGATDEIGSIGCKIYLPDEDKDGYSPTSVGQCLCAPDGIYTAEKANDCDDTTALLSPGVIELCDDKDQNCNQIADEGCDKDGDGFCSSQLAIVGTPAACIHGGGDCDDVAGLINPNGTEVCNSKDDNCDSTVDEGVTSPCGGCAEVCVMDAGPGQTYPWMEGPEYYDGSSVDPGGGVKLDAETIQLRSLWVSNSGEGTVSRLDTVTGKEVGRYIVCADPSRTAVAGDGSVWVGCRGDGKVAHIAIDLENCVDRNGNGAIETSKDLDGGGTINGAELLAVGLDECVLLVVQPDGATVARALAIDKQDKVWVGFWTSKNIRQLDPVTGAVLKSTSFADSGGSPYGLALDQDGKVWVSLRDAGRLGTFDPAADPIVPRWWSMPSAANAYGMAVDQLGQIWVASGEQGTINVFDPKTETFDVVAPPVQGNTRGVAASLDGFVYVAHYSWEKGCDPAWSRYISKIDAASHAVVANWDLGGLHGTVGVSIDFEGNLWAINQCVSTATKIDTATGTILGEYPTGASPYTYSDMTGFALKTVVAPVGTYTHVFQGWESGATYWKAIDAAGFVPEATTLELRYRTAATAQALPTALWSQWFGPFPPEPMPFQIPSWAPATGRYLAVQVRLRTEDKIISPQLDRLSATAGDAP